MYSAEPGKLQYRVPIEQGVSILASYCTRTVVMCYFSSIKLYFCSISLEHVVFSGGCIVCSVNL